MNRRDFLKGAGIILAAPVFIKSESLMKIWVPETKIALPQGIGGGIVQYGLDYLPLPEFEWMADLYTKGGNNDYNA